MKCLHCQISFHAREFVTPIHFNEQPQLFLGDRSIDITYFAYTYVCSNCRGAHIQIKEIKAGFTPSYLQAFPRVGAFRAPPEEVPDLIAADYREANEVIQVSPKASAALSRRCLQAILSAHGYLGANLMRQIDAVLAETDASKSLPTSLRENIDAIRNFGNFSAHPITDHTTLQIVEVEEGEAEWCLELLLDLFDHFYVAPARAAERRAVLAAKLAAAGKPPMKS
jgi:hypothetical protein